MRIMPVVTACVPLSVWAAAYDPVVVINDQPIAIEAEIEQVPEGWVFEKDVSGYEGTGYLRWSAGNAYNAPGTGELRYRILVSESGRYHVRLRLNTKGAEKSDLGNDVFTRFDEGKWTKTFVGGGSANGWSTRTKLEPKGGNFADAVYDLSAGLHTFCVSGRSHGLRIDRLIIWKDGSKQPADTIPANTGLPEAPTELTDSAVLSAWRQGGLGAVMTWATKQKDNPTALLATQILTEHADAQLIKIEQQLLNNPLLGLNLLEALSAQYTGCDKGKEIQKLYRKWLTDKNVVAERKASDMAAALLKLMSDRDQEKNPQRKEAMADAIRKGLAIIQKKCVGTLALADLERQVAAANLND